MVLGADVREDVHAREIHPDEERLSAFDLFVDEGHRGIGSLVVDGFHALDVQRARVFNLLRAVRKRPAVDHTAHVVNFKERGVIFRPIGHLRLLLSVRSI